MDIDKEIKEFRLVVKPSVAEWSDLLTLLNRIALALETTANGNKEIVELNRKSIALSIIANKTMVLNSHATGLMDKESYYKFKKMIDEVFLNTV